MTAGGNFKNGSRNCDLRFMKFIIYIFFLFAGLNLFDQGVWKELQQKTASSGETSLFELLKKTALHAKADGTVINYTSSLRRWVEFARVKSFNVFPASVIDISLFISHLSTTYKSSSVIQSSYCALKWVHDLAGVPNPMENKFLQNLVEGAKREHAKPVSKKAPVTSEVVEEFCIKYQGCDALVVRRDISMALLMFAGFLRYEIAHLKIQDVAILDTHVKLIIRKSKTDHYRKGNELVIYRSNKITCPALNLEKYMKVTLDHSTNYLFRPVTHTRVGDKLVDHNKPLSQTRARESLIGRLQFMGDATISLHSFRSGGATKADNAHVSDRCWKHHGRWKSDTAKDGYVEDSLTNRLQVSRALGV